MNESLRDDKNEESTVGTLYKMNFYEWPSLDGVVFIGLMVISAGILLMTIKLCYNYVRNFPIRKDSGPLEMNISAPKESHTSTKYSSA
ncbi:hypothetical protein GCK32_001586 [Trichostrongylus colubriformis]|uniref:Uncharacterized protein n=1 Tax=Trichostrongylus colubriformis TaxID=6319 RepID=A0AAN8F2I0_TRICO